MKCAIMQPTYMPWAGYFNLMASVDHFVFLDDAQFEKQSWQSRNRVLVTGKVHWLTVPVKHRHLTDLIHSIEVDDAQPWRRKHSTLLQNAYARHPFREDMLAVADAVLRSSSTHLSELNMQLARLVAGRLEVAPEFHLASRIKAGPGRSERLLDICRALNCDHYVSPVGAADYLAEDGVFGKSDVRLEFQNYLPREYVQKGGSAFTSHLSILDVIANLGFEGARQYLD